MSIFPVIQYERDGDKKFASLGTGNIFYGKYPRKLDSWGIVFLEQDINFIDFRFNF